MNFLNKMERKYGRYAIHNLSAYIIGIYVVGYLMYFFMPNIFSWLTLEPYYILKGTNLAPRNLASGAAFFPGSVYDYHALFLLFHWQRAWNRPGELSVTMSTFSWE